MLNIHLKMEKKRLKETNHTDIEVRVTYSSSGQQVGVTGTPQ